MAINRETVNEWLDRHSRTRSWLAETLDVGVSAVGNWLNTKGSARPIPAQHQITIQRLMDEDAAAAQSKPMHNLVLEFSDADHERIEEAARLRNKRRTQWAKRTLNEIAAVEVSEFAKFKVADDPVPYTSAPRAPTAPTGWRSSAT